MRQPNWDDIRIFLGIAATGSLSAAALHLGISQPTVGRRLRALEGDLGIALARRISNRIELTEAGRQLRDRAAAMSNAADGVQALARAVAADGPAPVGITATGSLSLFLAARIVELCGLTGGVPVTILPGKARANLAAREADIALRMRRLPDGGDLLARKLGRVAFSIYGSRDPADGGSPPLLIGLPRTARRPSQSAFFDDWAGDRPVPVRLGDIVLRREALRNGAAATLLPCWLGDGEPGLTRLIPPPPELAEDVYLMLRRDQRSTAAVAAVADGLAVLFARHAAALAGLPAEG